MAPTRQKVSLIVLAGLIVTASLVFAQSHKGNYAQSQLGNLQQASNPQQSSDSNYQVSAYPVPTPELVTGDGAQEVRIYCSSCHSPRYITMQPPLPDVTWEAEVTKMNKAFGAAIPDATSRKIVAYLQAHYATNTRRVP